MGGQAKIQKWHDEWGDLRKAVTANAEWDERHKNGPLCFGYLRVSTIDQVVHGHSLAAQKAVIHAYYESKLMPQGVTWGDFFDDGGYSAKEYPFASRPAAKRMIEACRRGDHIVVAVFDRAFRSVHDFANTMEALRTLGVLLHPLNAPGDPSKPEGRLMLNMLASFAQFESELKGARIRASHALLRAAKQASNERLGYLPLKKTGGKLVPCWETRRKMAEIVRARTAGKGFSQIAAEMPTTLRAIRRVQAHALRDTPFCTPRVKKHLASMTGLKDAARKIYHRWWDLIAIEGIEWVTGVAPDLLNAPDYSDAYNLRVRKEIIDRHRTPIE